MSIVGTIICAAIVSAIVSKVMATHYLEVIDGHVREMINLAKQKIEDAYVSQGRR